MWGNTAGTEESGDSQAQGHTQAGSSLSSSTSAVSTDASCGRAFILLKALVTQWLHDYKQRNDLHAYSLLSNCYRYLCGGSGNNTLLSDPTVHRIVYGLIIKLFKRLIVELKRLNVVIVYASFSKLIVSATGKYDIAAAEEYVSFVVDTVLHKELFQNLEIRIRGYYNQLFWYNANNWCGGRYPCDSATPEEESTDAEFLGEMTGVEGEVEREATDEVLFVQGNAVEDVSIHSDEEECVGGIESEASSQAVSSASFSRLPPTELQLSGFSKAATQARWQESKLFSMWSKQGQGDTQQDEGESQKAFEFTSSVALGNRPTKGSGKRRGGKRIQQEEENMLVDSDEEGTGANVKNEEYDFLDSLLPTPNKNAQKGSALDRDYYSGDEEDCESEENEPDIKPYGGRGHATRRRSMSRPLDSDDEYEEPHATGSQAASELFQNQEVEEKEEEASPYDFRVDHHWNMISHLPRPVVVFFEWVVAEYMSEFQRQYEDLSAEPETEGESLAEDGQALVTVPGREYCRGAARHRLRRRAIDQDTVTAQVQESMRSVLTVTLLTDMLGIMDQIRELYGPAGSDSARSAFDYSHTSVPDGGLFSDPVLEYVKACLAVICLDTSLPDEIAALRRGLLSQLKIREFSAASEFVDYNASFVLSDVICNYCNNCRYVKLIYRVLCDVSFQMLILG